MDRWEGAKVSTQVASQTNNLPFDQGTIMYLKINKLKVNITYYKGLNNYFVHNTTIYKWYWIHRDTLYTLHATCGAQYIAML